MFTETNKVVTLYFDKPKKIVWTDVYLNLGTVNTQVDHHYMLLHA
jgi:hypothetical protein